MEIWRALPKFCVVLILCYTPSWSASDCSGPQMSLMSDNPRHSCTSIQASKNRIEYTCDSLIKYVIERSCRQYMNISCKNNHLDMSTKTGDHLKMLNIEKESRRDLVISDSIVGSHAMKRPLIKYCPVEICLQNGTWTKPSISCALAECYEEGFSQNYTGHRMCTISGRPCQSWTKQEPHRHKFKTPDLFPDYTISLAESYCRDPGGYKKAPWCLTLDPDKKWEYCGLPKCSELDVHDNFCGPPNTDTDDGETEVKGSAPKEKDQVEHFDDHTSESGEGISSACGNEVLFKTKTDVTVKGKAFLKASTRSSLECSTLCAKESACRAFSFHKETRSCSFYSAKRFETRKHKGSKIGYKICA